MRATARWLAIGIACAIPHRTMAAPAARMARAGRGAPTAARAPRIKGHAVVLFVTRERAYFDRGAKDGLARGQTVRLLRKGRPVGTCALEAVSAHESMCVVKLPQVGDAFRLDTKSASAREPAVPSLPPLVAAERLDRTAGAIADAQVAKVDFAGQASTARHFAAGASFGHTIFSDSSSLGGGFQQSRVDVYLRGADVGRGFAAYFQASAIMPWNRRPATQRFRPDDRPIPLPQFYLWEAEVSSRNADRRYTLSIGRIWPWHAPGLTLLDGVQVGWHDPKRGVEVGAYGGLIPNAVDLGPSYEQWAGGVYSAVSVTAGKRIPILFRDEARIGVRNVVGVGPVIQAETVLQLWLGKRFDLGADARLSIAPRVADPVSLDAANVHLRVHPLIRPNVRLRSSLSFRYLGRIFADEAVLRGEAPNLAGAYRGVVDTTLGVGRHLEITALAAGAYDRQTSLYRLYVAGEVRVARLLGNRLDVMAGYQEEFGWVSGRVIYPQVVVQVADRFRLWLRASYNEERFNDRDRSVAERDIGIFANCNVALLRWLELRGSVLARVPLTILGDSTPSSPVGLVLNLRLAGSWN